MPTRYDVPVNSLIDEIAKELQTVKSVKAPDWAIFVKTGMSKERPPARQDWWFVRCAAVLRTVDRLGPIGTEKLRTKYGSMKNNGHKPGHFYKASGNILRKALQQLEAAGLIKKAEKGVHKGRVITPAGVSLMDKAAARLYKPKGKKPEAQPEAQNG
jgi:small subunit ribosomal protein S19e